MLHAVIAGDKIDADPEKIPKRQAIARYLLEEGADMDLHAWNDREKKPSPWQIVQHNKVQDQTNAYNANATSHSYYQKTMFFLHSLFYVKPKPSRGTHIAQILEDYRYQKASSLNDGK